VLQDLFQVEGAELLRELNFKDIIHLCRGHVAVVVFVDFTDHPHYFLELALLPENLDELFKCHELLLSVYFPPEITSVPSGIYSIVFFVFFNCQILVEIADFQEELLAVD